MFALLEKKPLAGSASTTTIWPAHSRSPLATLPGDVLILISNYLQLRSDILNLCLTSKHVLLNAQPELYSTVTLSNGQQCAETLGMLFHRPDLARHIRRLVVRPDPDFRRASEDRDAASGAILKLASQKRLDALLSFEWDAEEMPPIDQMWFALRIGCPRLKYISTSLGFHVTLRHSHLFDFSDLLGFSVKLKPGFYYDFADFFLQGKKDHPTLQCFWDMLMKKCPNLQELAIEGVSSSSQEFTVIRSLLRGRWPNLRKLAFGDVSLDPHMTTDNPVHPFITFLQEHPTLESISLSRHSITPFSFSMLGPETLPNVTEFQGSLEQLQALPHIHHSLKSLIFSEPMRTREFTPPAVSAVLLNIPNLINLEISFVLNSMYDSNSLLRTIVLSCPKLRSLSLGCTQKPCFQMDTFCKTVRSLTGLRTLNLKIVKYPGDESISVGAERLSRSNPRLESFSISFLPMDPPLSPFAIFTGLPSLSSASGQYVVTQDQHGLPCQLTAVERKLTVLPWGMGCTKSEKRYTKDVRPNRLQHEPRGVIKTLMERSTAGEETRMIAFSMGLVVLAVWGFFGSALRG